MSLLEEVLPLLVDHLSIGAIYRLRRVNRVACDSIGHSREISRLLCDRMHTKRNKTITPPDIIQTQLRRCVECGSYRKKKPPTLYEEKDTLLMRTCPHCTREWGNYRRLYIRREVIDYVIRMQRVKGARAHLSESAVGRRIRLMRHIRRTQGGNFLYSYIDVNHFSQMPMWATVKCRK